jgi:hypothetical protein
MVPRNVERLGIRELEVVHFERLGFPSDGDAPNAKWQTGETIAKAAPAGHSAGSGW